MVEVLGHRECGRIGERLHRGSAAGASPGACCRQAGVGAFADEVPLELGERLEDVEDKPATGRRRIDVLGQATERRSRGASDSVRKQKESVSVSSGQQTIPEYSDITYERREGVAIIAFNRPSVLNAFRPTTIDELCDAFQRSWHEDSIGVVVLTGTGNNFCVGGDVKVRGEGGYNDQEGTPRLQVTHLHRLIREIPKPVIAMVDGYAIGGGHVLHVLCELTVASSRAQFGQIGPKYGSFDGGFGAIYLARIVGEKKAREIWYLCRRYSADEALSMGLVNAVVPQEALEPTVMAWCKELLERSPTALRFLKFSFNADTDHVYGIQNLAHGATSFYYATEEGREGTRAFLERRPPDFSPYRSHPW